MGAASRSRAQTLHRGDGTGTTLMDQGGLDFSAPIADVTTTSPTGEALPPIAGRSPAARHASYTGAVHAQETRSANLTALRQLWREPRTINEMAAITGLPVSSVCSLKSALEDELEVVDFELVEWGDGRRPTKRTRWQLKTCSRREVRAMS